MTRTPRSASSRCVRPTVSAWVPIAPLGASDTMPEAVAGSSMMRHPGNSPSS
ncbi:hypothetical protein [Candidatus Neomicrothrix sp.]|uniref:hypothetical protein n=1 Tax=Candidatus Neomicrothrix sp. TaxID=2719034 RepID=UPI001B70EF76|nr:hypothetical protein [Candidatus Microthrix sp.]MBP6151792.1 hypothetical protein [Candidatus Microthrix sp.]